MDIREGRIGQTKVYVGKFFRIFINEKDWKVLAFAVVVSGILAAVLGEDMFVIKEKTRMGVFAIVSACIWIGIFNSIQTVCRERGIIKREHRTGLHISAYVAAHMIYQAAICFVQTVTMIVIYRFFLTFPEKGLVFGSIYLDLLVTFFLIIYCADLLGLAVSSVVKSTTAAMTVMPFLLIVQLIFSGSIFALSGPLGRISNLTISKWGMYAMCTEVNLNGLPSNLLSAELQMFRGIQGVSELLDLIPESQIQEFSSEHTYESIYEYKRENVLREWGILLLFLFLYGAVSTVSLEMIDHDRR